MNKFENEIICELRSQWKYTELNYQAFAKEWRRLDDEEQEIKDKESLKAKENRANKRATFDKMYELDKKCVALIKAIDKLEN
jgi:hypothetical protein